MVDILLLLLASAPAAGPAAPMLEKLAGCGFLEAGFVQVDYWALTRETTTTRGRMLLSQDGRFRLDYTVPDGRVMGFDGREAYTLDPVCMQILVDESGSPGSFTSFLETAGDESLVASSSANGDTVSVSLQGDLGGGLSLMEFSFLLSDSLPRTLRTVDCNGNSTSWTLSDPRVPGDPGPSAFLCERPFGYQVVGSGDI